jgi:hypothetical protein
LELKHGSLGEMTWTVEGVFPPLEGNDKAQAMGAGPAATVSTIAETM